MGYEWLTKLIKSKYVTIVLYLLMSSVGITNPMFSQTSVIADSLILDYSHYNKSDTIKIKKVLAIVQALKNKFTEKALLYADTAVILSEKINHPYFKAYSLSTKGEILISNGNYTEAENNLKTSLSIFEQIKRPVAKADIYTSLGTIAQYRKENKVAMSYFEKAGKIYTYYKLPDLVVQVEDRMASLHGLMGNPEKAIELKNKIISYYEKNNKKSELAKTWGSKARYHYLSGEISVALDCILRSLRFNEETGDLKAQLYNYQNLAVLYGEINNPEKAIEYAEKGILINRTVKNQKLENGLKNAICVAYAKLSDHKNAIKCYTEVIRSF